MLQPFSPNSFFRHAVVAFSTHNGEQEKDLVFSAFLMWQAADGRRRCRRRET
jgi:hypothetical protein